VLYGVRNNPNITEVLGAWEGAHYEAPVSASVGDLSVDVGVVTSIRVGQAGEG